MVEMQGSNLRNNLFAPNNLKYVEINDFWKPITEISQKNFMNGLKNARNILKSLERSLHKTKKYEKQLIRCKTSHSHCHEKNEWWDNMSEDKESKCSKSGTIKSPRSQVDLAESWSTMSIVCLQYQFEEVSKRYASLLQAYDERCNLLKNRDAALSRLQKHARLTKRRLEHAHKTLLAVGEKYLVLRDRKFAQHKWYEEQLEHLRSIVHEEMAAAECARVDLDRQIASSMSLEQDAATSLLLNEIMPRKYKRKTTRGQWSEDYMSKALDTVKNNININKNIR